MDQGFPGQHTTTVTASTTTVQRNIRYDPSYLKTIPGMLKAGLMLLNLLGFICVTVAGVYNDSRAEFFNTVSMAGFWFTGILLAFYIFHVIEKFYRIPWLKIELGICVVFTAFNMLASSLIAARAKTIESYAAAAFFGFCAMVGYGCDAWLKYVGVRKGDIAQGERQVSKQVSTVTSPAY